MKIAKILCLMAAMLFVMAGCSHQKGDEGVSEELDFTLEPAVESEQPEAATPAEGEEAESEPEGEETAEYTLNIQVIDGVGGKVSIDVRSPIDEVFECTTSCSETYPRGVDITLFAIPNSGYGFTGWRGDLDASATNPYSFMLNDNMNIQASFSAP